MYWLEINYYVILRPTAAVPTSTPTVHTLCIHAAETYMSHNERTKRATKRTLSNMQCAHSCQLSVLRPLKPAALHAVSNETLWCVLQNIRFNIRIRHATIIRLGWQWTYCDVNWAHFKFFWCFMAKLDTVVHRWTIKITHGVRSTTWVLPCAQNGTWECWESSGKVWITSSIIPKWFWNQTTLCSWTNSS